jgi:hypothetical protein
MMGRLSMGVHQRCQSSAVRGDEQSECIKDEAGGGYDVWLNDGLGSKKLIQISPIVQVLKADLF